MIDCIPSRIRAAASPMPSIAQNEPHTFHYLYSLKDNTRSENNQRKTVCCIALHPLSAYFETPASAIITEDHVHWIGHFVLCFYLFIYKFSIFI